MVADRQDTLKWKMASAAIAVTKESVTPIMKTMEGKMVHAGTGILFQVGMHKLMVTAAHVFQDILNENSHPLLLDAGKEYEQIVGAHLIGRSELCGEPFDIAITLLDDETVHRLPKRRYLPLCAAEAGTISPGAFCVGGFPAAIGLEGPDSSLLSGCMICTKLYTGSTAMFKGVNPMWHILIDRMDGKPCSDGKGELVALPEGLGGASGSPLFQTYKDGMPFDSWTPDHIRVVGVMTGEWREAMIATRWAAVLINTYLLFPELREDLNAIGINPSCVEMPAVFYS
jgi:hypothetical protein